MGELEKFVKEEDDKNINVLDLMKRKKQVEQNI
jgi:hypothetical protein